jgi:hypothetical protein
LDIERKDQCYNEYFINGYIFNTKEYGKGRNTNNSDVYVKGSIFNEFEVDYYDKVEEVTELQYHKVEHTIFLLKLYWYDIDRRIRIDPHHGLVKINKRGRLSNIYNIFIFSNNANKCITYTVFPLEKIIIELISYLL